MTLQTTFVCVDCYWHQIALLGTNGKEHFSKYWQMQKQCLFCEKTGAIKVKILDPVMALEIEAKKHETTVHKLSN